MTTTRASWRRGGRSKASLCAALLAALLAVPAAGPAAETGGDSGPETRPATRIPSPDGRRAALVHLYFGDSRSSAMPLEPQIDLGKIFEAYDTSVLLAHETHPAAGDVAAPSFGNLASSLARLADEGYVIDVYVFSHGWPGWFLASNGRPGSVVQVTGEMVRGLARAGESYTGFERLPIRIVYQMNWYGQSLVDDWLAAGAKAVNGIRHVNFNVNGFAAFRERWAGGETFEDAVAASCDAAWKVMDTLILIDALVTWEAWGGCPADTTVLDRHDCAGRYFRAFWTADDGDWRPAMSGREYMRHASSVTIGGARGIRFTSELSW